MALVDDLLEGSDAHGGAAEVVDLGSVLLGLVLGGAEALLGGDELLLHEEVVLDPLELEEAEAALGERGDVGEASGRLGALLLALLAADAGGGGGGLELAVLLVAVAARLAVAGGAALLAHASRGALPHGRWIWWL
ncbi:Os07g0692001, partial [Oryza sativa Japonica Group]